MRSLGPDHPSTKLGINNLVGLEAELRGETEATPVKPNSPASTAAGASAGGREAGAAQAAVRRRVVKGSDPMGRPVPRSAGARWGLPGKWSKFPLTSSAE
jgi:hypothetical protein